MNPKEKLKRYTALVISLMLAMTCMPLGAMAEEVVASSENSNTEVIVIPAEDETAYSAVSEPNPEANEAHSVPSSELVSTPAEQPLEGIPASEEISVETPTDCMNVPPAEQSSEDALTPEDIPVEVMPEESIPMSEAPDDEYGNVSGEGETGAESEEKAAMSEPDDARSPLQIAIDEHGGVYVPTIHSVKVYADSALQNELVYETTNDVFLLFATGFTCYSTVEVWFLDENLEVVNGYVRAVDLSEKYLLADEVSKTDYFSASEEMTSVGKMILFMANGSHPIEKATPDPAAGGDDDPFVISPDAAIESEESMAQPSLEQPAINDLQDEEPSENLSAELPVDAMPVEEAFPNANQLSTEETPELSVIDQMLETAQEPEEATEIALETVEPASPIIPGESDEQFAEESTSSALAKPNDYIGVTTNTRVLAEADTEAVEDFYCNAYLGNFVTQATVQVLSAEMDEGGNAWYHVRFLYGDTFPNGKMKWTDYATAWVLAAETDKPFSDSCTVTDFAFPKEFLNMTRTMRAYASPMNGFSLKTISGGIGSFYAGQSGLYGSSGKDSAYPQLAKSASHGTIYATPHYLEGYTVFCLEHTLSGPGEGSGSSQTAKGPYWLVDMNTFVNDSSAGGASGIRFSAKTMHALAWVLRHTYPFMAVNRSDSNNEVWSRVAGQFAMREVIKQLEGARYVRSYWNMDQFYAFSGGAPAVYLTYARWLASNGIAHAGITGQITAKDQTISASNGEYIGTVTLTTDADLIRIPKSVGTVTGNTAGSDDAYYYAESGNTIRVASEQSTFTVDMESVSSVEEEARFLIGVPSVMIQKVLVPIRGTPYPYKTARITFEMNYGDITVTKKTGDGILLENAVFELIDSSGTVLATSATNANGVAAFIGVSPGSYTLREKTAPQGYRLSSPAQQAITVYAGANTDATFTNERIRGVIRIVKTDSLTGKPLPGVVFTVTRLTAPASDHAADINQVVATLTTNQDGIAQTGELPWGEYRVAETGIPDGYVDVGFETIVTIN